MGVAEDKIATKPQHDDDDDGAQKLGHGVSSTLTDGHGIGLVAILFVDINEALQHLLLSYEGLDDAQTSQRLVKLCQHVAPLSLNRGRLALQLTTDGTHNPTCQRGNNDDKQGELPTDCEHRSKADDDGNGLANEHIDTAGDGILYSTHVSRHTGNDVALALLGEET